MFLVTGAAGHVGRAVVDRLIEAGKPVRVMTRDRERLSHLAAGVEIVLGNLDDPGTLNGAMSGAQAMYLMAVDEGTTQTANAVRAAIDADLSHVVQLSSQGVGIRPMIAASKYHLDREGVLQESGLKSTILRCGLFMSNALAWADSIRQDRVVRHSTSDGAFAPIDPADIGTVAAEALLDSRHTDKIYELTGKDLTTTREQVEILAKVLGTSIECVDEVATEAAARMRAGGAPDSVVDSLIELWTITRAGALAHTTDTVQRILGRPPGDFEKWCRANADAFR